MHRFMNWRELLQLAPNAKAVNAIMRDYLLAIEPLLGSLPEECQRTLRLDEELDVQVAAVTLLHCELRFHGSDEARTFLHEVAHTFAAAAVRITLLHGTPIAPSTD